MYFLIGVLILIGFVVFTYLYFKNKVHEMFGSNLSDIIKQARLEDEQIPKSLSSMDSIYLSNLLKDFPEININEIKRLAESNIISIFNAVDNNDTSDLKGKIKLIAETKINDGFSYSNLKFHNTVLSKYSKTNDIATIIISSSFEYISNERKVQDRAKVEFIYVIDDQNVKENQNLIGLNCPNCGSPIKTLGIKYCSYCQTGIKDIVRKVWICNDVKFY